ncbi:MAG TPA: O-antigen ligase family protein [Bacteroidales bacterium]|nr:O-antigen ligase family protein [Bacteroidales bacterium]
MMKKIIFFIKQNFQFFIFLLVAFFMPITKDFLPLLMFLWVISGLLTIRKIRFNYSKLQWLLLFMPGIFYLIHVMGMIHTSDLQNGWFDLEVKLSFLFAPVVLLFLTDKVKRNFGLIVKAFVLGNIIALAIYLFYALDQSIIYNEAGKLVFEPAYLISKQNMSFFELINQRYSHFSYSSFSFIHHPSYFSMYVLFTICIIVYFFRRYKNRISVSAILVFSVVLIFLSIMIWFLGSRAGYLALIVLFLGFIILYMLKSQRYLLSLGLVITGFLVLIVFMNPRLKKNIHEIITQVENQHELTTESDIRLWLWKSGVEVFQENYLWGVGIGDINNEMIEKYRQYNLSVALRKNYNLHNQYLESALGLGVGGLLILFLWFLLLLIYAINTKDFLLFFFTLIVYINFMFESMLNSIAGVSFFTFFYVLLIGANNTLIRESN